jgi:tRNA1Val (adenine37-N6)-methyltransferase
MSTFQFKQFSVDQSECAMKINTDGVLLGALTEASDPQTILDIGTGTGVIALMLAQRFANAKVDALEIDPKAAATAGLNFNNSSFAERLNIYPESFQAYFENNPDNKYDLIVSNPPFHIDSLKSSGAERELAKHTDKSFFADLAHTVSQHLSATGTFWVILPLTTAQLLKEIMHGTNLELANTTTIHSFIDSEPHRELLAFNNSGSSENFEKFVIYYAEKEYSLQYKRALKEFFTIF